MIHQLILFSILIDNRSFRLSNFIKQYYFSTLDTSIPKKQLSQNQLLSHFKQNAQIPSISKFFYFSNLINTKSQNSYGNILDRPIILEEEDLQQPTSYISFDFKSPLITTSSVVLKDCKFNALSSTQGTPDQTTGGAFYSNGFRSTFSNCTFMGNSAQRAAACAIINSKTSFNLCRFFQNKANIDIGAILFDNCDVAISECYFVENSAVLSIGAVLAKESTLNFEVVVFHMNQASYQTGALELFNTKANLNVNQFSNNSCTKESGGISINARNLTYLNLIGCNFETNVKENEEKHPIVFDSSSYLIAKMNCFDASENEIQRMISGKFENNFNKFEHKCPCNHVSFNIPYDVTEINVKVQEKMLDSDFFITVSAIFIVMPCVVLFMTKKNKKEGNAFQRL